MLSAATENLCCFPSLRCNQQQFSLLPNYTTHFAFFTLKFSRPSRVWDKVLMNLQGPGQAPTGAEGSHGHLADVVASQLQRALVPNPGLGILRERREAVHLLEDPQEELGELAAAFNQMSADLARANKLRRQMTANIAHDLRTPLSVIAGYTEALRDGVLQPLPETFQTLHQEAEHLSLLVKDLRTLSLADAGELKLTRQLVHPHELLERMAAAYLPKAQELEVTLQVTAQANVPPVNVDPERMVQVLGNLVSNALRYTPAGGQISLAAAQRGNNVLLTVQDNGVGIAPDELPRIFDRFYRGDEARQASEGESGLGLAIAKSLVELHGGTITVESALGEGATFTIFLPVGKL
jgi:signal transduction histidine kinase